MLGKKFCFRCYFDSHKRVLRKDCREHKPKLNKEVCWHCYVKNTLQPWCGDTKPCPYDFEAEWTYGYFICCCLIREHGSLVYNYKPPQENCPYFLEHIVNKGIPLV